MGSLDGPAHGMDRIMSANALVLHATGNEVIRKPVYIIGQASLPPSPPPAILPTYRLPDSYIWYPSSSGSA